MARIEIRPRKVKERFIRATQRRLNFAVYTISVLVLFCYACVFLVLEGEEWTVAPGTASAILALLFASLLSVLPVAPAYSDLAGALGLVSLITLVAVLLPYFGDVLLEVSALCAIFVVAIVLHTSGEIKSGWGLSEVRRPRSFALLALLPVVLSLFEIAAIGGVAEVRLGASDLPIYFLVVAGVWGLLEEVLFRGILQRSLGPIVGRWRSVAVAALFSSGLMVFWGSLPYLLASYVVGLVMGYLMMKTGSVSLVGALHALLNVWFVVLLSLLVYFI